MIKPLTSFAAPDVAQHYDHLDRFYLDVWGEHVHHGLWLTGRERRDTAVRQLVDLVALAARIKPDDDVCDIGSGYGAAARQIARDFGARVTAVTISPRQYEYARRIAGLGDGRRNRPGGSSMPAGTGGAPASNPTYLLGDFLENDFAAERFDAAFAVECASHIADLRKFTQEVVRVLKPGGRFVMCAWVCAERPTDRQIRHLLEPICREGRLAHLLSTREFIDILETEGLSVVHFRDLSTYVSRTWRVVLKRTLVRLASRWSYLRFILRSGSGHRVFLLTIFRLWAAYRFGAMRYALFVCRKPAPSTRVSANLA